MRLFLLLPLTAWLVSCGEPAASTLTRDASAPHMNAPRPGDGRRSDAGAEDASVAPSKRDAGRREPASKDAEPETTNTAGARASSPAATPSEGTVAVHVDVEVEQPWATIDTTASCRADGAPGRKFGMDQEAFRNPRMTSTGSLLFETRKSDGTTIESCDGLFHWKVGGVGSSDTVVWTLDAEDNLYHVESTSDIQTSKRALVLTKHDASGSMVWQDKLTTGMTNAKPVVVRAAADVVYAVGGSFGQLPGNPPEASGMPFVIRYDAASGEREWIRQERSEPIMHVTEPANAAVDDAGNVYVLYDNHGGSGQAQELAVHKLAPSGEEIWLARNSLEIQPPLDGEVFRSNEHMSFVVAQDGQSSFVLGSFTDDLRTYEAWYAARLDGLGKIEWARTFRFAHTTVVDESEGIIWRGTAPHWGFLGPISVEPVALAVADSNALYVVANYVNLYEHGANPPPTFEGLLVARYGLDASLDWARQYRVGPVVVQEGATGSDSGAHPIEARIEPDGDLLIGVLSIERSPMYRSNATTLRLSSAGTPR